MTQHKYLRSGMAGYITLPITHLNRYKYQTEFHTNRGKPEEMVKEDKGLPYGLH